MKELCKSTELLLLLLILVSRWCVGWQTEDGGSLVVVPLKDGKDRAFGVLAVDTVNDPDNRFVDPAPLFTSQDIDFYQVHASRFSLKICFVFLARAVAKL